MSCSSTSVQPLQFTFANVTLTTDGKAQSNGIAIQIGTPPQTFALTPTALLNNSFVNNIATCGSESNDTCISVDGGAFDPSASSTFKSTTGDSWNGSAESQRDAFLNSASLYFNDVLTVHGTEVPGFPLLIEATGTNFYAGLGLGKNSTFINRIVEAGLAPSRSWSIYPGVYSDAGAGSLMIGGYADRFYTGELHQKNVSDAESASCQTCFDMVNMTWASGGETYELLASDAERQADSPYQLIVDPYYPTLTVPDNMLWRWGNATNGTWNSDLSLYSYNRAPQGNLTITLSNGLVTHIPSHALFDPPAYDNGILTSLRNGSDSTIYSVFQPWSVYLGSNTADPTNGGLFGMPYAAYVYLIRDYERKTLAIANADQSAQVSGNAKTLCPAKSESGGGSSNHTGAIVGGVVGGVGGLALILALIWFFFRRRNKKNTAAKEPVANGMDAGKAEFPADNVVPPTYSGAGVNEGKDGKVGGGEELVQEMPAGHSTAEAPGTIARPPNELPASEGRTVRAELPG